MKKLFLFFAITMCLFGAGCTQGKGGIELTVSYYFNEYQGYKPDVGAYVYLFDSKVKNEMCLDSMNYSSAMAGMPKGKNGKWLMIKDDNTYDDTYNFLYRETTDVNGVVKINNIKSGKYLIILASKGRYLYSIKDIEVNRGETLFLTKNFGYRNEFENTPEHW